MTNHVSMFLKLVESHGLCDRNPELARYVMMARMGRLSNDKAKGLIRQLQSIIDQQEIYSNYLARAPDFKELYPNGKPEIIIGKLTEKPDVPLGLSLIGNMNSIFAGRADSGKTTGLRNLIESIDQFNKKNPDKRVSIICWDRKGGDYADIPQRYENWDYLDFQTTLKIGLNAPRGVPPNIWINAISPIFAARAGLIAGGICIANMIRFLVAAMNPKPTDKLLWPSFELLLDLAKTAPLTLFAAKPDYEKSLIHALEGITQAGGELFRTFSGIDLQRDIVDAGKSIVFDVCGLAPAPLRAFASDTLMLQLLFGRQYRYQRSDRVDCLFVLDEADQDVSRKAESAFSDLSPISLLLKQGREYGLAVALGLHAIGPAARMILTNVSHHFYFTMSDAESLSEAKNMLLLPRGAEGILPSLEPSEGECLYRGPGPWPHAMLANTNYIPPSRQQRPDRYDSIAHIPSQRLDEMPHVLAALDVLIEQHKKAQLRQKRNATRLSDTGRRLLDLATIFPFIPTIRLFEQIGQFSASVQKRVCEELATLELAKFEEVRMGSPKYRLVEVTDKGYELLGKPKPTNRGRGKIVHTHLSTWLCWYGKKTHGHQTAIEWIVPGTTHPVDAVWKFKDGTCRVFESVVGCENNLIAHLQKISTCSDVSRVTIVATQKNKIKQLKKRIESEMPLASFSMQIDFETIEKYIPKEVSK